MIFQYKKNEAAATSSSVSEKRSFYQTQADTQANTNLTLDNLNDIQKPITNAPPEVRKIIERVLQVEKDKLYQKNLRHINDDVLKIIKEIIQ